MMTGILAKLSGSLESITVIGLLVAGVLIFLALFAS